MYDRILFVCTGNTCRSPLAEGIFREYAAREGLSCQVRSAGVSALDGSPISKHSADILKAKGISDRLYSSSLTAETVAWADLILTMTSGHKHALIRRYPEIADKLYTLKEFSEDDPKAGETIAEWQRVQADLQIKRALGEPVTEDERRRAEQLERSLPDVDISDPYGGEKYVYEQCAEEIERYLLKLVRKLRTLRG